MVWKTGVKNIFSNNNINSKPLVKRSKTGYPNTIFRISVKRWQDGYMWDNYLYYAGGASYYTLKNGEWVREDKFESSQDAQSLIQCKK